MLIKSFVQHGLILFCAFGLLGCNGDDRGDDAGREDEESNGFVSASVEAGSEPKMVRLEWDYRGEVNHFVIEVNPDGTSGYSRVDLNRDGTLDERDRFGADVSGASLSIATHLADFDNGLYHIVAKDADGNDLDASDALPLMNVAADTLIGYFKASNTDGSEPSTLNPYDEFGVDVALSRDGDTLAVGAWKEDGGASGINGDESDQTVAHAGAVYVFTRAPDGSWSQQAYIKADQARTFGYFGRSVALANGGDTLAVGETAGATEHLSDVYVFERDSAGSWSRSALLRGSNTDEEDHFGRAVALSKNGDTLAVGAHREQSLSAGVGADETDNSSSYVGAAYVFTGGGSNWTQQAYIKASNPDRQDNFGSALTLSDDGDTLAVGAHGEASAATGIDGDEANNEEEYAGAVYVFERTNDVWSQQAYVKSSYSVTWDQFGHDLDLSGNGDVMVVGSYVENGGSAGINGDETDRSLMYAGSAFIFKRSEGSWSQEAYIKTAHPDRDDRLGSSVAISRDGSIIALGARGEYGGSSGLDGDQTDNSVLKSGAAFVFTNSGTGWSQHAYLKATNPGEKDRHGKAIALSADGRTLAVSANREDSDARGIDGDGNNDDATNSGAVYLY